MLGTSNFLLFIRVIGTGFLKQTDIASESDFIETWRCKFNVCSYLVIMFKNHNNYYCCSAIGVFDCFQGQ
jgi:hypothetical protein